MRSAWPRRLLVLSLVAAGCTDVPDASDRAARATAGEPSPEIAGPGTWRTIADGPLPPTLGHQAVWTGMEVVVWGGYTERAPYDLVRADQGAAYDPAVDRWRRIAPAPIPGGSLYSSLWTGREMLVWGDGGRLGDRPVGAAYDPVADSWRKLAPAPLPARSGHVALWTGSKMLVWGGWLTAFQERYDGRGAAYDPRTDRWRGIASGPLPAGYDAMGVWTGDEAIIMATPRGNPTGRPKQARAAAYDPDTDTWRRLAQPPMAAWASPPAVFLQGKMYVLSTSGPVDGGGDHRPYPTGGIYDVGSDGWLDHASAPGGRRRQSWPQTAVGSEILLGDLAYDPSTDSWRRLPKFPFGLREFPGLTWTGQELVVWGGGEYGSEPRPSDTGAAYRPASV